MSVHRKANIVPENYEYIGSLYLGYSEEAAEDYEASGEYSYLVENIRKIYALDYDPGTFTGFILGVERDPTREWVLGESARCGTCGASLFHVVVFNHKDKRIGPVAVGRDCAKDFYASSEEEMKVRRAIDKAEAERVAAMSIEAWTEFLAEHEGFAEALRLYGDHYILTDMAARGKRYGDVSAKSMDLAIKIAKEETIRDREALLAEAITEAAGDEPVPVTSERIEFTGTIIKRYWKNTDYGDKLVMIFVDDRGFKIWGTVPTKVWDTEVGDRLRFAATVEASETDPAFGFFKRPTKAEILSDGGEIN